MTDGDFRAAGWGSVRGAGPRRRVRSDRRRRLAVETLEGRIAPALSTWSGAIDGLWSTPGNWDVAPAADSDLEFPQTAANKANTNDLAAGTHLGKVTFSGADYAIDGNALSLDGPIDATQAAGDDALNTPIDFTGPATVNVATAGTTLTLGGLLSGSGGLTKEGSGRLVLNQANTYTGTTAVHGGVLVVDGAQGGSAVTVAAGATLGGSGTVGAIDATAATAGVRPGDSGPGILTTTGDLTLGAGSVFTAALNGTTAGADYSQAVVQGDVTLAGATLSPTLGFTPTGNESFTLIDNTGSNPVSGTFADLAEGAVTTIGGESFRISYAGGNGNDVVLTHLVSTSTVMSYTPPSPFYGDTVTLQATVTPASGVDTPTGTVKFFAGPTLLGTGTLDGAGVATATTSTLPSGTEGINAVYEGDTEFAGSTSPPVSITVGVAATETSLGAVPTTSDVGQNVTLTATVTAPGPGSGTPTGTVQFFEGSNFLGQSTLDGSGVATFQTTTLPLGPRSLTAKYISDGNFGASTSDPVTVTVNQAATTTNLSANPSASVAGQNVTLTATIIPTPPASGTPTGVVQFYEGTTLLGTAGILSTGSAGLVVSTLSVGSHSITAKYLGDSNYAASTSAPANVTVSKASTTTTVTSTPASPVSGQEVSLTATVHVTSPGSGTPSGVVQFFNGTTLIGSTSLTNGVATLLRSNLPLGNSSISAKYLGDDSNLPSTSDAITVTVSQSNTATNLSAPSAVTVGQAIPLAATVTPSGGGTGIPTGTVEFFQGSTSLGTATLSNGTATFTAHAASAGVLSFTAKYLGDTNFKASTSPAATVAVSQATAAVTLLSSAVQVNVGQPVVFRAGVTSTTAGAGVPTGVVEFFAGTTSVGVAPLVNGSASLTVSNLPIGRYQVVAHYRGDANFLPASSPSVNLTVGSPNDLFLNDVYLALLNRPVDAGGLAYWEGLLAKGHSRQSVVSAIAHSPEARQVFVQGLYLNYLGRPATTTEVHHTLATARTAGTSPMAVILGSREYLVNRGGGTADGFVETLGIDVLQAPLSQNAFLALEASVRAGTPRSAIAEQLLQTRQAKAATVESAFNQYLGRAAGSKEIAFLVAQLNQGLTYRKMLVSLLSSKEFYKNATTTL